MPKKHEVKVGTTFEIDDIKVLNHGQITVRIGSGFFSFICGVGCTIFLTVMCVLKYPDQVLTAIKWLQ